MHVSPEEPELAVDRGSSEDVVDRVLLAVELVPRGHVVSYGDIGGLVEIGARQVGSVMSRHGTGLPWWRVVNAAGELPSHLLDEARGHWLEEGITIKPSGKACRIGDHRADLIALATSYDAALGAVRLAK